MALMFQRLARNFIKAGYFPTDEETTRRMLTMLEPTVAGAMRIFDPSAGEGVILAECKQHLGAERVVAFGVEINEERAWHAKGLLDRVIHGDYQDTMITRAAFGLLLLNPPYGDLVSDKAATGDGDGKGRKRLEKVFYQRAIRQLQPGGVLVLIVPHYSLDREFAGWVANHCERVVAYRAPVATYKQVVVVGMRTKNPPPPEEVKAVQRRLEWLYRGDEENVLPVIWPGEPFVIPPAPASDVRFNVVAMDRDQLQDEIRRYPCLWPQFELHLGKSAQARRRPARALSQWHLALSLAAGQVSGVVRSNDGRKLYVVKGDTFKKKNVTATVEEAANGDVTSIRTETDVFVPVIRALDFTPGSETFGKALVIQ